MILLVALFLADDLYGNPFRLDARDLVSVGSFLFMGLVRDIAANRGIKDDRTIRMTRPATG